MFYGIKSYDSCSNVVVRHRHSPTIVSPLVCCPVDDTLFEVGPEIRCSGVSSHRGSNKISRGNSIDS